MSRRSFTISQKQSIIAEIDAGGDLKAILAREGLTHSHISAFRKTIDPTFQKAKKNEAPTTVVAPIESLGEIVLKRLDGLEDRLDKMALTMEPSKQLLEIQSQLDKITEAVTKK